MMQVSMFKVRQGNQAYLQVDKGSASEDADILCFGDALREKRVRNAPREKRVGNALREKRVSNAPREKRVSNALREKRVGNALHEKRVSNAPCKKREWVTLFVRRE